MVHQTRTKMARRGLTWVGACLCLAALPAPVQALDVMASKAAIEAVLNIEYPHLDALYKDIHSHPELGFQETRTAEKLTVEMRALGFEVTEHVGRTGIVAIYHNGPGPLIMVRTELDALPMEEKTGLSYASHAKALWNGREVFVDHSCGHDIHMAAWVGTAKALLAMKNKWHGSLMFIAQPAEEVDGGARSMLADGLYVKFGGKPTYVFALHDVPAATGEIDYIPGPESANADEFDVTFKGRGGHGAIPSATIDPILIASRFVVDVQSVISREKEAGAFGVVTVGGFQAGTAGNIIPDQAYVVGTIRDFEPAVRAKLLEGVGRVARAESAMAGAPAPDIHFNAYGKAVFNDPDLTARTVAIFRAAFGDQVVLLKSPRPTSEDFSEFTLAGPPGFFFNIGATDPAKVAAAKAGGPPVPVNHSPFFAPVPEPTIRTGVTAMTLAVLNVMEN